MSISKRLHNILRNPLIPSFYLPALIMAFSDGLLAPVLPLYAKGFDVSYGLIGLILAGGGLGTLLGDIPAGMLLRRLGKKKAMLLGMGCAMLSTAALFWTRSVPEVIICRLVTGFGMSLYGISRHAYVADVIAVSNRGRAISLMGGLFRLGRFAGPMVGGSVAAKYGLRIPFLLFAGTSAITLIVLAAFVRITETTAQGGSSGSGRDNRLLSVLEAHCLVLAPAGAGQLFAQMVRAGRRVIIPLYGADVIGLGVQEIGLIVSISSAVDMSLFYPAGLIMDRLGRKYAIVPSFAIQAVGMFLVSFTGSFVGLLLAATLIGFGNGFSSGSMMTLGADLAPHDSRGEFLGVWRLIGDAGATGGPIVVGGIADLIALPTAAWAMAGAGIAAATVFGLLVPETLKKHQRAARPS